MSGSMKISYRNLVKSILFAQSLYDKESYKKQLKVAYVTTQLADRMKLPEKTQQALVFAGLLYYIGFYNHPHDKGRKNSEKMFGLYSLFKQSSDYLKGQKPQNWKTDRQVLELAILVVEHLKKTDDILTLGEKITAKISKNNANTFKPGLISTFQELSTLEAFWFDVSSPLIEDIVLTPLEKSYIEIGPKDIHQITMLLFNLLAICCRETAIHSGGVAASAGAMAKIMKFSKSEIDLMNLAGCLHDIGKIAIPNEVLNHPGALTSSQYNIVKKHSYYTYHILKYIKNKDLLEMAAFHHERYHGQGYPFKLSRKRQSLGVQIMAVMDVFTALRENRPYRKGMSKEVTIQTLNMMAESELNPELVSRVISHFDAIDKIRIEGHAATKKWCVV